MAPSTYGKTWWRGGYACGCMIQSIEDIIEPRLRAAGYLGQNSQVNVYQYCYSGGVEASAGTHDGGGALDHQKGSDGETKIWRECGVADWQRGTPEDTYFDDHNHGIWQGCPHLSSGAEDQLDQYRAGCNGLNGWGPDQSPHVAPITWQDAYDKYKGSAPAGGIFGMSNVNKTSNDDKQTIKKGQDWYAIKTDKDGNASMLTGPAKLYMLISTLQVERLKPGQVLQARYGRVYYYPDKPSTVETLYPINEIIGTEGNAYGQIMWAQDLGDNAPSNGQEKIRLFVKAVDADCDITNVQNRIIT